MQDCRLRKSKNASPGQPTTTKHVTIKGFQEGTTKHPNPSHLLFLLDLEDSDGLRLIQVADEGSQSQLAHVIIQGVPADGTIDTATDITIMGQELLARVAARVAVAAPAKRSLPAAGDCVLSAIYFIQEVCEEIKSASPHGLSQPCSGTSTANKPRCRGCH